LTPTERRVLQELLSGKTEKQIAARLGVTPGSAHQYVTAIYRKFGTRGRTELMGLWLSRSTRSKK
jgi:DNA-binding CsgD family transcriptional regulator